MSTDDNIVTLIGKQKKRRQTQPKKTLKEFKQPSSLKKITTVTQRYGSVQLLTQDNRNKPTERGRLNPTLRQIPTKGQQQLNHPEGSNFHSDNQPRQFKMNPNNDGKDMHPWSDVLNHPPNSSFPVYAKGVPRAFYANHAAITSFSQAYPASSNPPNPAHVNISSTYTPPVSDGFLDPLGRREAAMNPSCADYLPANQMQVYSPSELYDEGDNSYQNLQIPSISPETSQTGQKRLSAFERLGPALQPKKPKLIINLLCDDDQSIREVVDPEKHKYLPVYLQENIHESSSEVVKKYLPLWPWRKHMGGKKGITFRSSKSAMLIEMETYEKFYERDIFVKVAVKGYPSTWFKEDVMDALFENLKGKPFAPCFIEFSESECKFLILRNRPALLAIHKLFFKIHKHDVELRITLYPLDISPNHLEFIPRLILRKMLSDAYDGERKLSLKAFTLGADISHFIYFPLYRPANQNELIHMQTAVAWEYLTDLDLSNNKLRSIDDFELAEKTPRLQNLNLAQNLLERATELLCCRPLALKTIILEGNPLCHNFIDPEQYVRVLRLMFPMLTEIDDVPVRHMGCLPRVKLHYCPETAHAVVDKFLGVYFPLLSSKEDRELIQNLYANDAIFTVTCPPGLHYSTVTRYSRNLFYPQRCLEKDELECVMGAAAITNRILKYPPIQHDPNSFIVDVLHHEDAKTTAFSVLGVLKITSDSLTEDEHLLAFTRTVVLATTDGVQYKIQNEMLHWFAVTDEMALSSFRMTAIGFKRLSLKMDTPPNESLKEDLVNIFTKITDLDKSASQRCLQTKDWDMKLGLDYFIKLLKLDHLDVLKN